jgi:hypothetical protein
VQISTAYGMQKEGSPVLPRNKYTEVRKPASKEEAKRPEFKVCKFTAEAIITEGSGVGTVPRLYGSSFIEHFAKSVLMPIFLKQAQTGSWRLFGPAMP